jgi:transcriptional regulator with XRE-family HTH domain
MLTPLDRPMHRPKPEVYRRLCDLFRRARARTGESQFAIAKELNWAQNMVSRIENETGQSLNFEDAIRLGLHFGYTPNDVARYAGLFAEEEPADEPRSPQWSALAQLIAELPEEEREDLLETFMLIAQTRRIQSRRRRGRTQPSG